MRERLGSPSRVVIAACVYLATTSSEAVEITGVAFDRGGINASHPSFASDTLRVAFDTNDPDVDVLVTLSGGGADRTLANTTASSSMFVLGVTDTTGGPALEEALD